jgi:hypothetical protein
MANCSICKAETELYINGVPICPGCDNKSAEDSIPSKKLELESKALSCSISRKADSIMLPTEHLTFGVNGFGAHEVVLNPPEKS